MLTAHKMSFIISKRNDYYLRRLIILKKTAKWITILAVSSLLAACQENNTAMKEDVSETVVTESTKDVHVHTNLTNEQKRFTTVILMMHKLKIVSFQIGPETGNLFILTY